MQFTSIFLLCLNSILAFSCFGPLVEEKNVNGDCPVCDNPIYCSRDAAKCEVKAKTWEFWNIFRLGMNYAYVEPLFHANGGVSQVWEGCNAAPGCCQQWFSGSDWMSSWAGADVTSEIRSVEWLCGSSLVVTAQTIFSYGDDIYRSYVFEQKFTWVPDVNCTYTILNIEMLSRVCTSNQCIPCSLCQVEAKMIA